jgi:hypothetical protein
VTFERNGPAGLDTWTFARSTAGDEGRARHMDPRRGAAASRLALAGLALTVLTGCPTAELPAPSVIDVAIPTGDVVLVVDDSIQLTVVVTTDGPTETNVTWTSEEHAVATVDGDGTVTAIGPGTTTVTATSTVDATKSDSVGVTVIPPGHVLWARQFGGAANDIGMGVAVDAEGSVVVVGFTDGEVAEDALGAPHPDRGAGRLFDPLTDAFVSKLDENGVTLWTRQFGTASFDEAHGVTTDGAGNVIVVGHTHGDLAVPIGRPDAFARKYSPDGTHLWTRQFGTTSSDRAFGVAADRDGNTYVTGSTRGELAGANQGEADVYLRKYDPNGHMVWTVQFGTDGNDAGRAVATDADGNVVVAGTTAGALEGDAFGEVDAFVRKHDGADGTELWTHQFGTMGIDEAMGVAIDAEGNVIVVGSTSGALEGESFGETDGFVRTLDPDGEHLWTRQFGTSSEDEGRGVATDASGHIVVTGWTLGDLFGDNAGADDVFVLKLGAEGEIVWARQFGTDAIDRSRAVGTDGAGNAFVAGITRGALDGDSAGGFDVFVRKYGP